MNVVVNNLVSSFKAFSIQELGIFSIKEGGQFSYSMEAIEGGKYSDWNFDALLDQAKTRQQGLPRLRSHVHAHNSSSFNLASPINFPFPHERTRFASCEPTTNEESLQFWKDLLTHDVSLIVMVKDIAGTIYYPFNKGERCFFGANREVRVLCSKSTYDPGTGDVLSELVVNGKRIYHLQVEWAPYMGLKEDHMYSVLQQALQLEQNNPGTTLVHCQQGVGRTGTFLACLLLMRLVEQQEPAHRKYLHLDQLLFFLRDRRANMIESKEQLKAILDFQRKLIAIEKGQLVFNAAKLKEYVSKLSTERALDVHVCGVEDVELDWFQRLLQIEEIAIRMCARFVKSVWVDGCLNNLLPNLRSLTLENSHIGDDVIEAIASCTKLTTLSLARSTVNEVQSIEPLADSKTITQLNLRGLQRRVQGEKKPIAGAIHLLKQRLPNTLVLTEHTLIDHKDYPKVLCTKEDRGDYRYCFCGPTKNFNGLLDLAKRYQENWEIHKGHAYTHNFCELKGASPIKCLDERVRIAAAEPLHDAVWMSHFWNYVFSHDVGLIVMVMKKNDAIYYPKKVGAYIEVDNRRVSCIEQIADDTCCISTLQLGEKIVYHMQLEWPGGQGIESNRLYRFIQEVKKKEQETPNKKTLAHCFAGVGRTGTFFGALILDQLLEMSPDFSPEEDYLDLRTLIFALRSQRAHMIEYDPQLETLTGYPQAFVLDRV